MGIFLNLKEFSTHYKLELSGWGSLAGLAAGRIWYGPACAICHSLL